VVVAVCSCNTTDFINIKDVIVIIVRVHTIVQAVIVVVSHSRRTVFVKVVAVVNPIVVNVQIHIIGNVVVVVVVDVGVGVAIIDFLSVINAVSIVIVIFNISDAVIIVVIWRIV